MTTPETRAARLPWDTDDPYRFYRTRRLDGPIVWDDGAGAWLVLGYHRVRQILGQQGWTSDPLANPNVPVAPQMVTPSDVVRRNILFADGADHRRLRDAVRDVFARGFVGGLADGIATIAADTVDRIPTGVAFDLMAEIALPLPIAVAAAWLGLGDGTTLMLRQESPAISAMLSDFGDPAVVEAGTEAMATLLTDFLPRAAHRRRHPGDDLLSFIGADPALELDDAVTMAIVIAVAGHETTANMLGTSLIRLMTPARDGVRPIDTVEVDERLVNELLRLDGPVQAVSRTATEDHDLDGVRIRAGEPVLLVLAAANRDPTVFDAPDELRPDRSGPAPLTFGHGAHFCLGAALARLEIAVALTHVRARRPALCGDPVWRNTPAIRGPQCVPVRFTM